MDSIIIPFAASATVILLGFIVKLLYDKYSETPRAAQSNPELVPKTDNAEVESDEAEEMPIVERHVRVIDQKCGTEWIGMKDAHLRTNFIVTFEDDNGEQFDLDVGESLYLYLSERNKESGTLAFIDDKLFDYVSDREDTADNE